MAKDGGIFCSLFCRNLGSAVEKHSVFLARLYFCHRGFFPFDVHVPIEEREVSARCLRVCSLAIPPSTEMPQSGWTRGRGVWAVGSMRA